MAGMAAGADLLVARTALELGIGVDAVLPMPMAQYAADFEPAAHDQLRVLLGQPNVQSVELALPARAAGSGNAGADGPRDAHYSNLTEVLVRGSNLLIALWDGMPSVLPGGTADTVLRYLSVRTDRNKGDSDFLFADPTSDQEPPSRLAYWIPVVRRLLESNLDPGPPCFLSGRGDNVLQRWPSMLSQLNHRLSELNANNREYHQRGCGGPRRRPP